MPDANSVLAVIPARGGSKGILKKNIQPLHGKPLIAWTIEAALSAQCIDRCIVSTDDEQIANIAIANGAQVPFMRPAELARDETPGVAPVLHALTQLPEYEWVVLLQPTSPLRRAKHIDGAFSYCLHKGAPACVSVCEVKEHPNWMFHQCADGTLSPVVEKPLVPQRQALPKVMRLNGAIYIARTQWLLDTVSFVGPQTVGFEMSLECSLDIDEPADLLSASQSNSLIHT